MTAPATSLSIRRVASVDTDAIITAWQDIFPEYFDPAYPQRAPRPSIERKLAENDGLFWLATDAAGAVLGTIMAGYDGHRGWIYSLGVGPALRGTDAAAQLLVHAEAALRARGCVKVNMQVLAKNERALKFYAKQGYANDDVVSLGKRL